MPARRCNEHGNWPTDKKQFGKCPECGEKTDVVNNADPMDHSEMCHRLFAVHCAKLDAERDEAIRSFEAAYEATPSIPDPDEPAAVASDEKPEGD